MTEAALKLLREKEEVPEQRPKFMPSDITGHHQYDIAIKAFLCNMPELISESNCYKVIGDELWFIRKSFTYTPTGRRRIHKSLCAKKINGEFFGNASDISGHEILGRGNHWRKESGRIRELMVQDRLSDFIPMVPFTLFKDSGLDIELLKIVEKGAEEKIDIGRKDKNGNIQLRHFTGAMLFSIGKSFYMFDIDRNEVKMKNINMWMSKLARPAKSIEDAYASLKPKEVSDAERFLGKPCDRQGEWFFIPVQGNFKADDSLLDSTTGWSSNRRQVAKLQAKGNRAHFVSQISKEGYVRGTVSHEGMEHKNIELETWCRPIPNTAIESFKISGAID